ncbi:MAG: NUDIX domain-containing protein [Candidatus Thorarchaeota archaeon]|nr:NUDIX domain-containing protein [Candidatus Thorarchaeota archaeon]
MFQFWQRDEKSLREKVFVYVTRGSDLLVFTEREFERSGLQIPAGSPKEGESLEQAALRETQEETGLLELSEIEYLGSVDVDQSKYGIHEIHRRHFYHVKTSEETPERWANEEKDPSIVTDSTPDRIVFDLSWISLIRTRPKLAEDHDAFLSSIIEKIVHQM